MQSTPAAFNLLSKAIGSDAGTEAKLGDGAGVSNGTVQYLAGLCSEALGDFAGAQRAWQAAAQSQSGITEDGPPVKELATRKLADLQRRTAPGAR